MKKHFTTNSIYFLIYLRIMQQKLGVYNWQITDIKVFL